MRIPALLIVATSWTITLGAAENPAHAQKPAPKRESDLQRFIAADFCAALVIHPSRMAKSDLAASLPDTSSLPVPPTGPEGVDLAEISKELESSKVKRVVVLIDPLVSPEMPVDLGIILQFEAETDSEALFKRLVPNAVEAQFEGSSYLKGEQGGEKRIMVAFHKVGPKTVLVGSESSLKKMLQAESQPRPLGERLRSMKLGHDLVLELLVDRVVAAFEKQAGAPLSQLPPEAVPPPVMMFATQVVAASVELDFSGETLLHATLACKDKSAANQVMGLMELTKTMAQQQFGAVKQAPPEALPPQLSGPLMALGDQLLKGTEVKSDEAQVELTIQMPDALAELVKAAGAMVPPAGQGP